MKKLSSEAFSRRLFLFSAIFLAYVGGLISGIEEWSPAPALEQSVDAVKDFARHWKNDLGIEPTRLLVERYDGAPAGISGADPERMADGYRLVAGLTPGGATLNGAWLLDRRGEEIHRWPLRFDELEPPSGRDPENVFLHGLLPLPDGSLVVNFDSGHVLARIDACGNTLWRTTGRFHHAISRADDGSLWSLLDDVLVNVDVASGRIIRQIDVRTGIVLAHDLQGVLGVLTTHAEDGVEYHDDPFHINHVEPLTADLAEAFPMFEVGDLLVSMRNINLVGVVDGESADLEWWRVGPWHRQHDPHFLPDGTISVYNNNMGFGSSQIMVIDPRTNATEVLFAGDEDVPFYSWRRGKHRVLDNGNILITESERGRVVEVTRDGSLVWEFNNAYDDTRNGVLSAALVLPYGFFEEGAPACVDPGRSDAT